MGRMHEVGDRVLSVYASAYVCTQVLVCMCVFTHTCVFVCLFFLANKCYVITWACSLVYLYLNRLAMSGLSS